MNYDKSILDLKSSKAILSCNIDLFHSGERELYRVIATELRKLLCEGRNSLLIRLVPGLQLESLMSTLNIRNYEDLKKKTGIDMNARIILQIPGTVESTNGKYTKLKNIFSRYGDFLPIKEWLEQPFLNRNISLRDFIKSVADKESVHSDREYDNTLKLAKSAHLGSEEMHKQTIIAIGEYILEVIEQLEDDGLIGNETED